MTLGAELTRTLDHRVRERHREGRSPGLVAGIVRDGDLVWSVGVGACDVAVTDVAPDAETAFAIGSISKTFTAALILALRDEGKLTLADRLSAYLPGNRHGALTLRELLSHASGLQREPVGDVWDSMVMPSIDEVVDRLDEAEQVLPARLRWHYSNLAFALLGEVVARVDGRPWATSLQTRLLDPLGMTRTSMSPTAPQAVGYYTDPYTDQVHLEKWIEMATFSAAGGLWSTVADLGRWASFLASGADGVLSADTIEEMSRPEIMADLENWTMGWGLGLQLFRSGERVMVGHGGAMPGFLAGLAVRRIDRTGAVVLSNTSAGVSAPELAVELVGIVLDAEPTPVEPWRPGPPVPAELAPLVGRWWSEGSPFTFSIRDAHLEAMLDAAPTKPPAVFEQVRADLFRPSPDASRASGCASNGPTPARCGGWSGPATRSPAIRRPSASASTPHSGASAASLVTTIAVNVPINRATGHRDTGTPGHRDTENPPVGWERTRSRWEFFLGAHSWLLVIGFVLVCPGATA